MATMVTFDRLYKIHRNNYNLFTTSVLLQLEYRSDQ